jgi:ABC-type glutathione transport system ATPase component
MLKDIQLVLQNPGRSLNHLLTWNVILDAKCGTPRHRDRGTEEEDRRTAHRVYLGKSTSAASTRLCGGRSRGRVALPTVLPKLVVCDERPGLGRLVPGSVLNLLCDLQSASGILLFITHDQRG